MHKGFSQLSNNFTILGLALSLILLNAVPATAQTSFMNLGPVDPIPQDVAVPANPVPPVTGLTAEAIDLLQGQKGIPKVEHLDRFYSKGTHRSVCKKDWNRLRAKPVNVTAFEHNLGKIEANARRMGIWGDHLKKTLATFKANQDKIPNQRYISFINFNRRSNKKRFYIVDLQTGAIKDYYVSAGKGSDPDGNGFASKFSNRSGTNMSSLGCVLAGGRYSGKKNRPSLYLHGFSDTNDRSCDRAVVMHPAGYVGGVPARSWGCPAVRPKDVKEVYNKISGGGLLCSYQDGGEYEATHKASKSKKYKKKKKYKNKNKVSKKKKSKKRSR